MEIKKLNPPTGRGNLRRILYPHRPRLPHLPGTHPPLPLPRFLNKHGLLGPLRNNPNEIRRHNRPRIRQEPNLSRFLLSNVFGNRPIRRCPWPRLSPRFTQFRGAEGGGGEGEEGLQGGGLGL